MRGVETGAASAILVVGGDATGIGGYAKVAPTSNCDAVHLALGRGGLNGVYALVASRQMKTYGLEKSDYGHLAVAQRAWAACPMRLTAPDHGGISRGAAGGGSTVAP